MRHFFFVCILGLKSPDFPLFSGGNYSRANAEVRDRNVIGNERVIYYQCTGLMRTKSNGECKQDRFVEEGQRWRLNGSSVVVNKVIGIRGFNAGPDVHILDQLALSDPLLARLPTIRATGLWIGHFEREIPQGYVETLSSSDNTIANPNLAEYYDKLHLITRGKLFDLDRLAAIWDINTGKYDFLLRDLTGLSEQLKLAEWEGPLHLIPGEENEVTLYWEIRRPMTYDNGVFLYLTDSRGNQVSDISAHSLVLSTIRPGDIMSDTHHVDLLDELPAGEYSLVVGVQLYQETTSSTGAAYSVPLYNQWC